MVDKNLHQTSHAFKINTPKKQPEHCQLILTEKDNGYFNIAYTLKSIGFPLENNIEPMIE